MVVFPLQSRISLAAVGIACIVVGVAIALKYGGTPAPVVQIRPPSPPTSAPVTPTTRGVPNLSTEEVMLTSGFECSRALGISQTAPLQFVVRSIDQVATGGFYFLLHIRGVKGSTITFRLNGAPFMRWGQSVPQYGYVRNLATLNGFQSNDTHTSLTMHLAARPTSGPALPDTSSQSWHYFEKTWREADAICVSQHFEEDAAYIAFRVPYTPQFNEAYLENFRDNPNVELISVGSSAEGRPLRLLRLSAGDPESERSKPCILIYAREHPDEQDASWVTQGMLDFLVSEAPEAQRLRQAVTYLVIPLFDPDGATSATHENIISGFSAVSKTPETIAYANWFKKWVDEDRRLDLTVDLHDPMPGAAYHVACPQMEGEEPRLRQSMLLHEKIRAALSAQGYRVRVTPWGKGRLNERLMGYLSENYGTLGLPYEINSLTPMQQLNLAQLRTLGRTLITSASEYLISDAAKPLLADVDRARQERKARWAKFGKNLSPGADAIIAENFCTMCANREAATQPTPQSEAKGAHPATTSETPPGL
jgi:hypothetical protein